MKKEHKDIIVDVLWGVFCYWTIKFLGAPIWASLAFAWIEYQIASGWSYYRFKSRK